MVELSACFYAIIIVAWQTRLGGNASYWTEKEKGKNMDKINDKNAANAQKYKLLRDRWDKEDSLLISRTGIFLTTNSILFAALGFQERNPGFQVVVAVIGLLLSILWLTTSWHTFNVIKKLYRMSKDDMPYELVEIYHIKPILFRPNSVFTKIIPLLIIFGWIAIILWILVS